MVHNAEGVADAVALNQHAQRVHQQRTRCGRRAAAQRLGRVRGMRGERQAPCAVLERRGSGSGSGGPRHVNSALPDAAGRRGRARGQRAAVRRPRPLEADDGCAGGRGPRAPGVERVEPECAAVKGRGERVGDEHQRPGVRQGRRDVLRRPPARGASGGHRCARGSWRQNGSDDVIGARPADQSTAATAHGGGDRTPTRTAGGRMAANRRRLRPLRLLRRVPLLLPLLFLLLLLAALVGRGTATQPVRVTLDAGWGSTPLLLEARCAPGHGSPFAPRGPLPPTPASIDHPRVALPVRDNAAVNGLRSTRRRRSGTLSTP